MVAPLFRTVTAPADQPVLYQLSIRAPGGSAEEVATYTFPLSPSSLRTESNAMSTYTDTQGPAVSQGVTRVIDRYGLTPPMFSIEGTTGWDYHSMDGYVYSGLQSMQLLKAFLANYETLNQNQLNAGNPDLYTLEFYDYFSSQFWIIEPVGAQIFRQSADRPLLTYYRFKWAAIAPAGTAPDDSPDDVADTLSTPPAQATSNTADVLGATQSAYGYDTAGLSEMISQ